MTEPTPSPELIARIRRFVCNFAGIDIKNLGLETRLYHDCRIGGEDAADLLRQYSARFSVTTDQLVFADYFPGEEYASALDLLLILFHFAKRLFSKERYGPPDDSPYLPLTVGDLVVGASAGTLLPRARALAQSTLLLREDSCDSWPICLRE